ncbi:AarF/ABC1/UbiB kinase family protein [Acaryochloris sp. CCMEE 5410]|uniref:ABC1 kinase family protein n=1 Tax=Acaryochloris sp. CCMEE 5410 TaxID=310037 RepID=UPI0002483997|nr:AarF/ABC1/UbiB kinase family protein [Acaryochloris sp. CCMEE 5410]KAI9131414.1 AarF/ABC1/UbiB kinase family protein [Acaryochloris sp. CCMEE 5410]
MFSGLTQTASRQRDIIEVVLRNGWDYMQQLLTGGKADQPALPTPAVLRNILVDLGPVYVKLGQLLSTRPDILPAPYIDALSTLQSKVPPVAWPEIKAVIQQQIAQELRSQFKEIDPTPVASGSIAQVHRAILANGQQVAIKVQRPGIDVIVNQDIALINTLADLASRTDIGKDYDLKSLAAEFANALLDELDFTVEASHTEQLRQNLSTSRWFDPQQLVVPKINLALTTQKVLVMQWLDGEPLLSANLPFSQQEPRIDSARRQVTTLLFRAFLQQIYVDGFFHADPHPGNLYYLNDGRAAILDCGMVGRLDPNTQQILTEMLLAIVDLDAQRCSRLTLQLAKTRRAENLAQLESDFEALLRKYYNRNLAEINLGEVLYEVLQVARTNKLKLPGNVGLYVKALANLEGAARTFDPKFNVLDEIKPLMSDLFRRQFVGEDPLPTLLRTALDVKNLSLRSPRQLEQLLDQVTSESLQWNLNLLGLNGLRITVDNAANRLSFSILVGSLIMGAAMISAEKQTALYWLSNTLFAVASLLGLWLAVSILRSGNLR